MGVFTVTLDDKGLHDLALEVNRILQEQLAKAGGRYYGEARVYDAKSVGVQGDDKTYLYVAEITIKHSNGKIADPADEKEGKFIEELSCRITNEVRYINRVMYVLR